MPRPAKNKPMPLDLEIDPLGPRLARLREFRGFSQYSLAEHMGISRKQIADYERGLAHPNDEMIIRLAITLKVTTDTLLGLKDIDLPDETPNIRFTKRLRDLEHLPESKKRAIIKILDEFTRPEA
jgi:transcriptional regulator with XRE-family HTH domain